MGEVEPIVIDGTRFCAWREGKDTRERLSSPSAAGLAVGAVLVAILFAAVIGALRLLPSNPRAASTLVLGTFAATLVVPYAWAWVIILRGRLGKRAVEQNAPARPEDVPPSALFVDVALRSSCALGGTTGWLFLERGVLRFHGERFDFALAPGDFRRRRALLKAFTVPEPARLNMPKGLSLGLLIRPATMQGEKAMVWPAGKDALRQLLEEFATCPKPSADSLFPPVLPGYEPVPLGAALVAGLPWMWLGVETAAGIWALWALAPPGLLNRPIPWGAVVMVALFAPLLPAFAAWGSNMNRRAATAAVQKRAKRGP